MLASVIEGPRGMRAVYDGLRVSQKRPAHRDKPLIPRRCVRSAETANTTWRIRRDEEIVLVALAAKFFAR
jgi:hypothetical protein